MNPQLVEQLRQHFGIDPETPFNLEDMPVELSGLLESISQTYDSHAIGSTEATEDALVVTAEDGPETESPPQSGSSLLPCRLANIPFAFMQWDLEWRAVDWNQEAERVFGISRSEALGSPCLDELVDEGHRLILGLALAHLLAGLKTQSPVLVRKRPDGYERRYQWFLALELNQEGTAVGVSTLVQDVTDSLSQRFQHADANERLDLSARGARDGLWDLDVNAGTAHFSPRCFEMLGLRSAMWKNLEGWLKAVHPSDREKVKTAFQAFIDEGNGQDSFDMRWRMLHITGRPAWIQIRAAALRDPKGRARRLAGSMTDITERMEYEARLLRNSRLDALTGIPNRRHFLSELERALQAYTAGKSGDFAVLFIDLDRFKIINDARGHAVGDGVLREIAQRLVRSVRRDDQVGRLGGDEFAVLLTDVTCIKEVLRAADRMTLAIRKPLEVEGNTVTLGASIGVVISDPRFETAEQMIQDADIAMYRAKCAPEQRTVLFDQAMHDEVLRRGELENDLRNVCSRNELWLAFQPIYNLATGEARALEALLRWNHPTRGLISPGEFIPLAEASSLIVELGNWVLDETLRMLAMWEPMLPKEFYVTVNLSARHLHQADLVDELLRRFHLSQVSPQRLGIEVTESSVLRDEDAAATIHQLRQLGVRVLMDDFGTGYSSVSSLHEHQFDVIKIDKSFVQDTGMRGQAFLRALIALSRSVGTQVVAEGVEELEQLNLLRSLGADYGQGYLLARPMDVANVTRFLRLARTRPRAAQAKGRAYWAS